MSGDMSEQVETVAHAPVTISIDVAELLKSELGWRTVNVGAWDDPEPEEVPGGDGHLIDIVAMKLADVLQRQVADDVSTAVREKVLEKVDGLIDEVMAGTITLTSAYGEPKSPEMTLREAMIKAMSDRLDSKVDSSGKVSSGAYRSDRTYLQWHAQKIGEQVIDKEMSKRLTDAAKQIKNATTELIGNRIAEVLGRGF